MAKNKNRDRGKHQDRSSTERGAEQPSSSSTEAKAEQIQSQVNPSDVAHKGRQKRFGHN
ncbi:hypothetical protein GCM10011583_29310 [Streptomyces camponoticapitis]|uniref:Small hydrophilic protein n=1 Tax=Streptomyces camponoticapitis TaxID=1616125 RepID=A0ABQ2E5X4_9ACTN|nr:hypothetical protein [Streptomyces camponoticapitis]GGJ95879.1 hypothetical protein GCM10011583_29310 [Streptomyces camponoticapitis]